MTITAAIRTAVETQTLPAELADRVSSPAGCGGLDEWLHSTVRDALDAMDTDERAEAIEVLHHLASAAAQG